MANNEVVGLSEAAAILGLSRTNFNLHRKRYAGEDQCPAPTAALACGPVWVNQDKKALEKWAKTYRNQTEAKEKARVAKNVAKEKAKTTAAAAKEKAAAAKAKAVPAKKAPAPAAAAKPAAKGFAKKAPAAAAPSPAPPKKKGFAKK